jgi:hypothetical protein
MAARFSSFLVSPTAWFLAVALVVSAFPSSASALQVSASPTAQASANLFAVVDGTGTLVNGNRVLAVTQLDIGQYEVTFDTVVSQCAYVATTANAFADAITVFTAGGVYVEVKNQGGGLTDGPFHLYVACGTAGTAFAVVGYAGNLVRSTPGTTLTLLGPGQYSVNFPTSVAACAYIATVGDPANALVFAPSGVYTGSRPTANAVYIETKNPAGGLQPAVPFHLAVVCPQAADTGVAVVNANGIPNRGSALTSSFNSEPGHYTIATNTSVSRCATLATRGSVDTSVPFNPATVEVIESLPFNTTALQVRALGFFGGGFVNEAFHAAIIC